MGPRALRAVRRTMALSTILGTIAGLALLLVWI